MEFEKLLASISPSSLQMWPHQPLPRTLTVSDKGTRPSVLVWSASKQWRTPIGLSTVWLSRWAIESRQSLYSGREHGAQVRECYA